MKSKSNSSKKSLAKDAQEKQENPEGYLLYPDSEDIYAKSKEEKDLDPEDVSKVKTPNPTTRSGKNNEKSFKEDVSGGDLDIPGSEEDEEEENSGSEDEENNFYSLGGDDHNDLDEDKGN
jgi:hypothetical protein